MSNPEQPLLRVEQLTHHYGARPACVDVSFDLWPGEVLGIAGVDGNGQKHLAEVLAGQRAAASGSITLGGTDVTETVMQNAREMLAASGVTSE